MTFIIVSFTLSYFINLLDFNGKDNGKDNEKV